MPGFRYKAVTAAGTVVEGGLEASDKAAAVARLRRQGQLPIRVEPERAGGLASLLVRPVGWRRGPSPRGIAVVTRELATLIDAGLTLEQALQILVELGERSPLRAILTGVLDRLRSGAAFNEALAAYPSAFPAFYRSLVKAGEAGGALETVLARLADHLDRSLAAREAVRSALAYPVILLFMVGLTVALMVAVVLPQFEVLFADADHKLPTAARIVMAVAEVLRRYWFAWPAVAGALVVLSQLLRRHPAWLLRRDAWLLRWPLLGGLLRDIETARFSRTLATMLGNGIPAVGGLALAAETVRNTALRRRLAVSARELKEGRGLARPLSGALPHLAVEMMRVGEETGRLDAMLAKIADIYDAEVQRLIGRMLALLMPATTILLGLIVAGVVGAVLSAILSVYDAPL